MDQAMLDTQFRKLSMNDLDKIYKELGEGICLFPFIGSFYKTFGNQEAGDNKSIPNSILPCSLARWDGENESNPWEIEPGTTIASFMLLAILRPFAISAAARKSSIRPFVQEPINTLSIVISVAGIPALTTNHSRTCAIAPVP